MYQLFIGTKGPSFAFVTNKTAARLAQLDKRRSAKREAAGSSPRRTNTQGL